MNIPDLINDKKKYFGTYAVMALLNAHTVLDHIQKLVGLPDNDKSESDDLWQHPVMEWMKMRQNGYDAHPETTVRIMDRLQFYFPFLKIMAENQRVFANKRFGQKRQEVNCRDIHDVLERLFRVLKKYRDTTTHYVVEDSCWDDDSFFLKTYEQVLAVMLNKYYDVALRDVKERYSYKTEALAFIQNYRYKMLRGQDGRRKTETNLNFFLSLMAVNGDTKRCLHLSGVGVALLVCLFLDRQYVNLFLTKLPFISRYMPQSEERRIILRSFAIHCIALPKDRLCSEKSNLSVAMDMLNEVKRCPDELFRTLSAGKQSLFRIMSTNHDEVLMKRSPDRFAQLVLQYIDYGQLFSDIRFHVNMGKLRYLFNPEKHCIDGQTRVRVIEHQLNGYGRIADVEALRRNEDGGFADTGVQVRDYDNVMRDDANPANYPYVVDTYTHYLLENNKVEMVFCDKSLLPDVREENGKWYVGKQAPDCRMSVLELSAMIFHMFLLGSENTERRIREVYDRYMALFGALERGVVTKDNLSDFGIAEKDLPQKVLDIVNGCAKGKDVDGFLQRRLVEMFADTERRQARLDEDRKAAMSDDNKMGKRSFRQVKPGRIAQFLAEDIVRFQPTHNGGMDKLTGMNYRVMQSAIAVYDSMGDPAAKNQFREMFEKAHLIGGSQQTAHPFLQKVFARTVPENAIIFYERYLAERHTYLTGLMKKVAMGKCVTVPFVNRNRNRWNTPTQQGLGKAYCSNVTVELPRQMFDEDIKQKLATIQSMAGVDIEQANVTYLIGEFVKRELGDDFQEFYSWQRNYRFMDMLIGDTDRKGALSSNYTSVVDREKLWQEREARIRSYRSKVMKSIGNGCRNAGVTAHADAEDMLDRRISAARIEFQKNEKTIRRYRVQDALLFLLAKNTLTAEISFDGTKFRLKDIMPDAEKGLLSEIMPMTFIFKKNGRMYTIQSDGMKLKNYGDFFVLANDRRLGNLLQIVGSDVVSKEQLTDELRKYDRCRPDIVEIAFNLEKWAYDTYPGLQEMAVKYKSGQFGYILDRLLADKVISNEHKEVLRKIRNAFDHNDYPKNGVVNITTLPDIARSLADMFGNYAKIV